MLRVTPGLTFQKHKLSSHSGGYRLALVSVLPLMTCSGGADVTFKRTTWVNLQKRSALACPSLRGRRCRFWPRQPHALASARWTHRASPFVPSPIKRDLKADAAAEITRCDGSVFFPWWIELGRSDTHMNAVSALTEIRVKSWVDGNSARHVKMCSPSDRRCLLTSCNPSPHPHPSPNILKRQFNSSMG